jgi:hypothetical protein
MKLGKSTYIALCLGIGSLLVVGLSALLGEPARIALADQGMLFVSTLGGGTECSQSNPCGLQTALSEASDGETIYVAGGTYTGTGSLGAFHIAKSVAIYGGWSGAANGPVACDPTAYPTTLDGEKQRRVVRVLGNVSPTLDGFLITNGRASGGAGIGLDNYPYPDAAPIIRNCVITNNVDYGSWGGGILSIGGSPVIEHCRITSNTSRYQGGGVGASWLSRPTLWNNVIAGNLAEYGNGAGVRLRDAQATLVNNTVAGNTGAIGEGVYVEDTTITLTNNIIVSNTYGLRGGGDLTATIAYNDVWGNTTANYEWLPDLTGSNGNTSLAPLFVSGPGGDYYLSQVAAGQAATSPCVDAGSDSAANLALDNRTTRTDREGDSGTVDMGYHYRLAREVYLPLVLRN